MQTPPLLVLVGLSARTKLYSGNSKWSLSDEILKSKQVSERHIIFKIPKEYQMEQNIYFR